MKQLRIFSVMFAFIGLSVCSAYAQKTYIITKSGSNFSVTIAGGGVLGSPNATLQNKIDDIKADASGMACTIQFGNGTNTLDLGGGSSTIITFSGSWGIVTLTGKATSACTSSNGVIRCNSSILIESKADITVTGNGARAIYMFSGELTVSAGTMQTTGTNGIVIFCWIDKTLTISGGTVQATGINGSAVVLYAGNAKISGGTIKATNSGGEAIQVMYFDIITISDNAIVSSKNTSSTSGTIHLLSYSGSGSTLEIKGGTVENTASGGNAIYDESFQNVTISGGTLSATTGIYMDKELSGMLTVSGGRILAKEGYAINNNTGTLTISGGMGFAYGTAVTDVIKGTFTVPPVNSAVLVAWNKAAGTTTYGAGSSNDIFVLPTTITAVWANQGGSGGILGTLGSITGFIPIEGVTVEGETGIEETHGIASIQVYPNPVKDVLNFSFETSYKITDLQGRILQESDIAVKSANISHLPKGIYIVTIITKTGKLVTKIIKE